MLVLIPNTIEYEQPSPQKPLAQVIVEVAYLHEIDAGRFLRTAKCESSLNPSKVGDGGESFGLFQIHLPSHPTVTREMALDPMWAIEWSAEKFRINPNIWTCYRRLYQRD